MAFASVEPFGDVYHDIRAGTIAATVANVAGAGKRRGLTADDFFPIFSQEKHDRRKQIRKEMSMFKVFANGKK